MAGDGHKDRKRLEDYERLYRGLFEQTAFGMARVGLDGRWLEVNDRLCAVVGYDRDELLARTFKDVTHPGDLDANLDKFRRVLEGQDSSYWMDKRYICKNGLAVWVQVTASLIRDEAGRPDSMICLIKDIGERKQTEEALRQSQEWLQLLIESVRDFAIFSTDPRGRVASWNAGAERCYGFREDEILGQEIDVIFTPEDRAAGVPQRELSEAAELGQAADNRWHLRKDGSRFLVRGAVTPMRDRAGAIVGFVKATHDITERIRLEENLRAARQQAEEANKAKDDFLAVLSHELRTPLNPIMLAVSSMIDQPPRPEELAPALEMIRQNVDLQARIIDDLLDVMKIVRGKMPLHWGICDCDDLIRRVLEIIRTEVRSKDQRIKLDLNARNRYVNADAARLQQVLWNLIKNAVKFTPEGGTITVSTRNECDEILVEVADTGMGIEPEAMRHIFDAFHQGDAETTRKFGGLGLGLAICRGVVEAHGGHISADSPGPGRGATFRIRLKTTDVPGDVREAGVRSVRDPHSAEIPARTRLNILLVEDEPTSLQLMSKLLVGLGHDVVTAGTAADAWGAFQQTGGFDLIISDIGLPDGSGLDLMQRFRAVRSVPAIALTGYGMEEDIRRSREAGFSAHLTKPIDFSKLAAMIRQVAT